MGWGGCKLGQKGVGLGEDIFVSLLQVFTTGVDVFLNEDGQLVCIYREEDAEQHYVIVKLQRPMG
jgi:hypothetical protein